MSTLFFDIQGAQAGRSGDVLDKVVQRLMIEENFLVGMEDETTAVRSARRIVVIAVTVSFNFCCE